MSGDTDDFDAFYAESVGRVTGYLYAVTGSRAEAEDAAQEAFARAWQHWPKVSDYTDPEAWVRMVGFRIAVSAWHKMVRRTAAHRRHGVPDNQADLSPDYVAIVAALRKLPAGQRQAIVLHHLSGLSVSEISREVGVPTGTVKARLSRGRRALAMQLGENGPETGGLNGMEVPNHA